METEEIWKILEQGFGDVHESTDKEERDYYLAKSKKGLDIGIGYFKANCSASAFNSMVLALLSYQYWTQKKVKE
jgi:hypothetical protein